MHVFKPGKDWWSRSPCRPRNYLPRAITKASRAKTCSCDRVPHENMTTWACYTVPTQCPHSAQVVFLMSSPHRRRCGRTDRRRTYRPALPMEPNRTGSQEDWNESEIHGTGRHPDLSSAHGRSLRGVKCLLGSNRARWTKGPGPTMTTWETHVVREDSEYTREDPHGT